MKKYMTACGLSVLLFVGLTSSSYGAVQCVQLFPAKKSVKSIVPKMKDVVNLLRQLDAEKEIPYFVDSYSDLDGLLDPDYGYQATLKSSVKAPINFVNKMNEMAGGLAASNYNIYAEGYFRQIKTEPDGQAHVPTTREMAQVQPWLEWSSADQIYQIRRGNLAQKLLQPYLNSDGQTITLYRGARHEEVEQFQELHKTKSAGGDMKDISKLFAKKDALFFTPNFNVARGWGDEGAIISMTFKIEDLLQSYAGIEYKYIEVAIFEPSILNKAISSLVITPVK